MTPTSIKFEVLNACLNSTILFGCEIWVNSKLDKLEKQSNTRSARPSVNNEIIYIESGQYPLFCDVKSRQSFG